MTRIVWIDDRPEYIEQLRQDLAKGKHKDIHVEFVHIRDVVGDVQPGLANLEQNPPDVLLMDWDEGSIEQYYPYLITFIPIIILVSNNSKEELHLQQAFVRYSELEQKTLQKPINAIELLALIKPAPKSTPQQTTFLTDILPLRYLDENFAIIGKSGGWKLADKLIDIYLTEKNKAALINGEGIHHSMHSIDPSGSGQIGPIHVLTTRVPTSIFLGKDNIPEGTRYIQHATSLPATGVTLEEVGSSVEGIIELMLKSGRFKRGRYYKLSFVPGLKRPALELIAVVPVDVNVRQPPLSRELDGEEFEEYSAFCRELQEEKKNGEKRLIHMIKGVAKPDPFWTRYSDTIILKNRLCIPVFGNNAEINLLKKQGFGSPLLPFAGIFVFDKGDKTPVTDEDVKSIGKLFLSVLKYFAKARMNEKEYANSKVDVSLLRFHSELNKLSDSKSIERELAEKVCLILGAPEASVNKSEMPSGAIFATYARYNARGESMDVVYETGADTVLLGLRLPLVDDDFLLQQCGRQAIKGITHPIHEANFHNIPDGKKNSRDKAFLTLMPERYAKWQDRMKSIHSVIVMPVMGSHGLLGALMVRSSQTYAFTNHRVNLISRFIEAAQPYMARHYAEQLRRNDLEVTIMHETRSHINHAKTKLDRAINSETDDERNQALYDLQRILDDEIDMSTAIMRWFGRDEKISDNGVIDSNFWNQLNAYGDFYARSYDELTWNFYITGNLVAKYSFYFKRVTRILINNAFRHSDPNEGEIICKVDPSDFPGYCSFIIKNPGEIFPDLGQIIQLDQINRFEKTVGLNLVKFLCDEIQAPLPKFKNENGMVTLELLWPVVISN